MNENKLFDVEALKPIFPGTRYQGSKAKLTDVIWELSKELEFESVLDLFGGTGAVSHMFKAKGKQVIYNDYLRFNCLIGKALIENSTIRLDSRDILGISEKKPSITYPSFIEDTFHDIYFTQDENRWLDIAVTNINAIEDEFKRSLAFFAVFQACIIKRPYNLFHRKNLYVRTADVPRSFGNKVTWDKPFNHYLSLFSQQANLAVFDNGKTNRSLNFDALSRVLPGDLIYIDSPYLNGAGIGVDYHGFYHFLEGLTSYSGWADQLDSKSKHKRIKRDVSPWSDKKRINRAFDQLFDMYSDRTLVISYRSDGIPSITEIESMLKEKFRSVRSAYLNTYTYALSKNRTSKEVLVIARS